MTSLKMKTSIFLATALLLTTTPAQATIVTFEDITSPSVLNFTGTGVTDNGLAFSNNFGASYLINGANPSVTGANNGTSFWGAVAMSPSYTISITPTNSSAFNVQQLDLGLSYYEPSSSTVTLTGNMAGGGSITDVVLLNSPTAFQTVALANFNNLTSLSITQDAGGYLAMDNVNYSTGAVPTVPVPGAIYLFATGLGLVAARSYKKQNGKLATLDV